MECKLSIFGSLDAPVDLADEGMEYLKSDLTFEDKQLHRRRLFEVTREDVVDAAARYFNGISYSTVIGQESRIETLDGFTIQRLNLDMKE